MEFIILSQIFCDLLFLLQNVDLQSAKRIQNVPKFLFFCVVCLPARRTALILLGNKGFNRTYRIEKMSTSSECVIIISYLEN